MVPAMPKRRVLSMDNEITWSEGFLRPINVPEREKVGGLKDGTGR